MKWGLTITGPQGPVEITDFEYYEHFGDPLPEEPELCEYGQRVLGYFQTVHRRRQSGMGLSPLSYTEIRNWWEMTRSPISANDVELITRADDAYMEAMAEGHELRRKREERKRKK